MEINLNDWTLKSNRTATQVFVNSDESQLLKIYKSISDEEMTAIAAEYNMSSKISKLGVPTPGVIEIAHLENGCYGVIYENIKNKVSLSRAVSQDKSKMDTCMIKFARMGELIHETEVDDVKLFDDIEEIIKKNLPKVKTYTDEDKQIILDFMASVPKTKTLIHGDFHPGNVITNWDKDYVIDVGDFTYGNPLYDWAQWFFMSHYLPEDNIDKVFHMSKADIIECWRLSVKYSFGYTSEEQIDEFEKEVEPFLAFVMIAHMNVFGEYIEYDLAYQKKINSLFK